MGRPHFDIDNGSLSNVAETFCWPHAGSIVLHQPDRVVVHVLLVPDEVLPGLWLDLFVAVLPVVQALGINKILRRLVPFDPDRNLPHSFFTDFTGVVLTAHRARLLDR